MKKTYAVLALTVVLAFFLRFYKVAQIPPSLSWDEVSIGYNAYSILKTGRDEFGRLFPLDAFVAYGDYKPVLPVYLTVPFVALFGLSELAVRLPSVVAGTLTVLLTYFLVRELFNKSPHLIRLSLLASFLLAISPWHMQLSRAGFEANTALFFVVLGIWCVLKARERNHLFIVAWLPFVASIYTFNSARYFAPILGVLLIIYCWKEVRRHTKQFVAGVIVAFVFLFPIVPYLISPQARLRFAEVNIFTDFSVVQTANHRIETDGNSWWSKIFHNRRIGYTKSYLLHLLDHFEPSFLFIRGDGNPKFSIQDVGQLHIIELPLLIAGIYWLFVRDRRTAWFLAAWLIGAIIPAATARETPHALRIENSLPVWQIFIACGLLSAIRYPILAKKKFILLGAIAFLYSASFSYYWHNYFTHYVVEYSGEWQYGYREAIRAIEPIKNQYDAIVMTENIGRPHMYIAFYERLDPGEYRKTMDGAFDAAGFYNPHRLGKYRFVRQGIDKMEPRILYVLEPQYLPDSARVITTVRLLNGKTALVLFDQGL
ncbi:glycosyltransferase family 39 protein [Candidatus Gottesmanbacteria bacterium]|nr:glycosyltransferase family 39 protein [Candidatus Gottesmanbacteria bacterium]